MTPSPPHGGEAPVTGSRDPLKVAANVASAVGAVVGPTCILLFGAVETWSAADLKGTGRLLPLLVWTASPYIAFVIATRLSKSRAGTGVALALSVAATLFGGLVYFDAVIRRNLVLLLLFVSIPFVQWGAGIVSIISSLVLRSWKRPGAG